jgi:hypothetical protein
MPASVRKADTAALRLARQELIFKEFNTLSVVYNKHSSQFVVAVVIDEEKERREAEEAKKKNVRNARTRRTRTY